MFKVRTKVDAGQVRGLLCCAFEGGSNYWYVDVAMASTPEGYTRSDFRTGGKAQTKGDYWHWSQLLPTMGGSVTLRVEGECGLHTLDAAAIERGLQLMADAELCDSRHWADFVNENEDACTGDVFLQLCLFGDVVFG